MSDSPEEIHLIEAAKRNPQAFEVLYVHYHDRIFRFIWAKLRDSEATADVTSDVFLKALLHIKTYEHRGLPFSAWLFRLATNEVNLFFRRTGKVKHVSIHPELRGEWDTHWENAEWRQGLAHVLDKLPPEELRLLEWRFFDGFSFKDMAAMESSTEAAVKMKVYRILDFLKTQLKHRGPY